MLLKNKKIFLAGAALVLGFGVVGLWNRLSSETPVAQAAHDSNDVPHVQVLAGNSNKSDPWLPQDCAARDYSDWQDGSAYTPGHTDCVKIRNTNYRTSYTDDFRFCLQIEESIGSASAWSCSRWASEGGGNGPIVAPIGHGSFYYTRAKIEGRPNPDPNKSYNNSELGVSVQYGTNGDVGTCKAPDQGMVYAGSDESYWSFGMNKDDEPGCIQAGLRVQVDDPPVYNASVTSASATVNPNTTYSVALDATNLGNHYGASWTSDMEIPGTKVGDCSNFVPDDGATCEESVIVASNNFKLELINPGATPITLNDTDNDGNPNRIEYRRLITTNYSSYYNPGEEICDPVDGGGGILPAYKEQLSERVIGMLISTAHALPRGPGGGGCFTTEGYWAAQIQESPSRAVIPNSTETFGISYNTNGAAPGNYALNFRMVKADGQGGRGVDSNNRFGGTGTLSLTVGGPIVPPNFQLLCSSITPQTHTATLSGSNQTFTYTVPSRSEGGYTGTVTLAISGNPSGTSVNNGSVTHPPVDSTGNVQIVVTPSAATGSASMFVNATAPGISFDPARHSCPIGIVINPAQNFRLVCNGVTPQSVTMASANQTVTYTVPSTAENGYSGTVTLAIVGSPVAANADTISHPPINSSGDVRLPITTSTPPGTYNMTINATASGIAFDSSRHSCPISLTINPITPTPTPTPTAASPGSFDFTCQTLSRTLANPGDSTTYTFRTRSQPVPFGPVFGGSVTISLTSSPTGTGATPVTYSVSGTPGTSGQGTITVTTDATTTPGGTHVLTFTGTAGAGSTMDGVSVAGQTATATCNLVVPAPTPTPTAAPNPDYTVLCAPATHTMKAGSSHTVTITTTPTNGYSSPVTWSVLSAGIYGGRGIVNPPNPPTITFTNNGQVPPATTLANITTTTSTSIGGYRITFSGTGGGVTNTCYVDLTIELPDPPNGPTAVTAANTGTCETVTVTWRRNPSGLDPDYFRLFRSTNSSGPWTTQIGADVPYSGNTTTVYSRTDTPPENPDGTFSAYYYAVIAYRGSSPSTPSVTSGIVPIKCEARLDTSDKDMTLLNGSAGTGSTQDPCNGNPELSGDELIPASNTLFKPGDTGTFRICARNSGNVTFSNGFIGDTLENLETPGNYSYSPASCAALFSASGNSILFTLVDLPAGNSCTITFTAKIKVPATSGTIERFLNRAVISGIDAYNSDTISAEVHTRPYNFSTLGGPPSRNETAP